MPVTSVIQQFLMCLSRLCVCHVCGGGGAGSCGSKFLPLNFNTSFQFVFHKIKPLYTNYKEEVFVFQQSIEDKWYYLSIKESLHNSSPLQKSKGVPRTFSSPYVFEVSVHTLQTSIQLLYNLQRCRAEKIPCRSSCEHFRPNTYSNTQTFTIHQFDTFLHTQPSPRHPLRNLVLLCLRFHCPKD